jgi:hypothetical protein
MATTTKIPATRVNAGPLNKTALPSSTGQMTTEDRKLLQYVRTCAPRIVAALVTQSSDAGGSRDWTEMNEYLTIANTFANLVGLAQIEATPGPGTHPAGAAAARA